MLRTFSSLFLLSLFVLSNANHKPAQRVRFEFQQADFVSPLLANPPNAVGLGGEIHKDFEEQWRTLSQQRDIESTSLVLTLLKPCGVTALHYHPRGSEIAYVAKGNNVLVGFVEEDGGRLVLNKLNEGDATLFEEGLIHFIANQGCDNVTITSGFSNKDPGSVQIALNTFMFPTEIIAGSFGMTEEYVDKIKKTGIPFSPVEGSQECLRRCENHTMKYKYDADKSTKKNIKSYKTLNLNESR